MNPKVKMYRNAPEIECKSYPKCPKFAVTVSERRNSSCKLSAAVVKR